MLEGKLKTDYEKMEQGQFEFGHYSNADDIRNAVRENKSIIMRGKKDWFTLMFAGWGAIAAVGYLIYNFTIPDRDLLMILASAGVAIGLILLMWVDCKYRRKYLLAFNQEGLYYRSPFRKGQMIQWENMSKVGKRTISAVKRDSYTLLSITKDANNPQFIKLREFQTKEFDLIEAQDLVADFIIRYWKNAKTGKLDNMGND